VCACVCVRVRARVCVCVCVGARACATVAVWLCAFVRACARACAHVSLRARASVRVCQCVCARASASAPEAPVPLAPDALAARSLRVGGSSTRLSSHTKITHTAPGQQPAFRLSRPAPGFRTRPAGSTTTMRLLESSSPCSPSGWLTAIDAANLTRQ
jgi:hypothetical protein